MLVPVQAPGLDFLLHLELEAIASRLEDIPIGGLVVHLAACEGATGECRCQIMSTPYKKKEAVGCCPVLTTNILCCLALSVVYAGVIFDFSIFSKCKQLFKCIASSNKCLTSSNNMLLGTSASAIASLSCNSPSPRTLQKHS